MTSLSKNYCQSQNDVKKDSSAIEISNQTSPMKNCGVVFHSIFV